MNWPSNSGLSLEVEQLLNNRIKHFLDANSEQNGGEDGIEVQRLIIDLYVIYKNSESPLETARLQQKIIQMGKLWDTDDPAFAQIQKYVNRVLSGQYSAATIYLSKVTEHLTNLKAEGATDQKKKQGAAGGQAKHAENNKAKADAVEFYKQNQLKYTTKKAAAVDLETRFPPLSWQTYRDILKKL